MDIKKWQQKFSPLNQVEMPEEFKSKMIEKFELSDGQPLQPIAKVPVSHRRIWLGTSAAGIACTAVIAGGLFLLNNSNHPYKWSPSTPAQGASNATNTALTNDTVAQTGHTAPSTSDTSNKAGSTAAAVSGSNHTSDQSSGSNSANPAGPKPASTPSENASSNYVAEATNSLNSTNTTDSANSLSQNTETPNTTSPNTTSAPPVSHHTAQMAPNTASSDSDATASANPTVAANSTDSSSGTSLAMTEGALALFPPQITGTIVAIEPGNPSIATLKDATEVAVPNGTRIHHDSMTIQLPAGGWVGAQHWQSVGNTLDLFLGEQILDLNHESSISGISSHNYQGIIQSVQDNQIVIQLVEFAGTNAQGQPNVVVTDNLVTLYLKPYTTISWEGNHSDSISALKPHEPVLIVDEGISSYEIARQITVFPDTDTAGWQVSK